MSKSYRLGQSIYGRDQEHLGKLSRDVQLVLNQVPVSELRVVLVTYREPLPLTCLEEPFCLELVRVLTTTLPETPVRCGGMVHWYWSAAAGGAVITSIDGLDPLVHSQQPLRLYFRITYTPIG